MSAFLRKHDVLQMSDSFLTAVFVVLSGGLQDAYTYINRGQVFANAQTGNVVLMSANLFNGEFAHSIRYLIPLLAFMFGTFIAEHIQYKFKNYQKFHWRQMIVIFEIILLFIVGFIPQQYNAIANALVSFVCAMQVQTFNKVMGHDYASTMCIGNMKNAVVSMHSYIKKKDKEILKKSLIYFGIIIVFAIGAGIGSLITLHMGEKAIWICCAFLTISFLMMFVSPKRKAKQ